MNKKELEHTPDWIGDLVSGLPELVSESEVAELLGVSLRTMGRWRLNGRIRAWIQTSRSGAVRIRIPRIEVARLLGEMSQSGEGE